MENSNSLNNVSKTVDEKIDISYTEKGQNGEKLLFIILNIFIYSLYLRNSKN